MLSHLCIVIEWFCIFYFQLNMDDLAKRLTGIESADSGKDDWEDEMRGQRGSSGHLTSHRNTALVSDDHQLYRYYHFSFLQKFSKKIQFLFYQRMFSVSSH